MSSITRLARVIAGPVAGWTGDTALYDAGRLGSALSELEAGRRFAARARANRGRVRRRDMMALTVSFSLAAPENLSCSVPLPKATAMRTVDQLVIRMPRGRRETFDAADVRLVVAAVSSLGRLFLQAQTGTVGPIMLEEFESALAAIDRRQRLKA